jgi:hypothetical protein
MAKIAVLLAATLDVLGVASNREEVNALRDDRAEDEILEVTAKTFQPSDKYKTFKDMCLTKEEREAKAAEEQKKADEKAAKEKAKADAKAAKEASIADAGANKAKRASPGDLTGTYRIVKPLPACADDHPKKPIWVAIEQNSTVETAKAACPEVNPPRKTSGVYTFTSEFRYFLKTGYVAMGDGSHDEAVKTEGEAADQPGDTAEAAAA